MESKQVPQITSQEFDDIITISIKLYGRNTQIVNFFQEMTNLQGAILEHLQGRDTQDHVCEKIADISLRCLQMASIYGIGEVEKWGRIKLASLREHLAPLLNHIASRQSTATHKSPNPPISDSPIEDTDNSVRRAWVEYHFHQPGLTDEEIAAFRPLPSDNFAEGFNAALAIALNPPVPVSLRLPDVHTDVLVYVPADTFGPARHEIAYWDGEDFYTTAGTHIRPSHWLQIPPLPAPNQTNQ